MAQSYSRTTLAIWPRAREAVALYQFQRADAKAHVTEFLDCMKANQVTIERHLGEPLCRKTIFEIGPGQMLKQARFFGAHNNVTAVDLDKVAGAWDLAAWWDMLRKNGPLRFAKTLARNVVGIDRAFLKEMARQMPASTKAQIISLQRDAANSGLRSSSFDCAMSFSVFEHLPEPRRIFQEIKRLLRPGGSRFISCTATPVIVARTMSAAFSLSAPIFPTGAICGRTRRIS